MAQAKKGPARPCRIFLCYRSNTAETANHFRSVMEHDRENSYGNIWYSSRQYSGRLIRDLPEIMSEAEWVIFFIGETFTGGFIDENEETNKHCVTAHELIAIETERQKRRREGREELKMLTINIDDAKLDRTCELDLKHLFSNAKILEDDSVGTYTELLPNVYNRSRDDLFDFVEEHIAPICALPKAPAIDVEPVRMPTSIPNSEKENEPERGAGIGMDAPVPQAEAMKDNSTMSRDDASISLPGVEAGLLGLADALEVVKNDKERIVAGTKQGLQLFCNAMYAAGNMIQNVQKHSSGLKWLENGNVLFGSYPQTVEGKQQPIEWQVLKRENDSGLLISKYVLDVKPYNDTDSATTWAECSLRNWLNGRKRDDFLETAFTKEEQEQILVENVFDDRNPSYQTDPGKTIKDRVFLLSVSETAIFFYSSDTAKRCAPTDYAIIQGALVDDYYKTGVRPSCSWWLRSPGSMQRLAVCVDRTGCISVYGCPVTNLIGVRPALWIKL